jgi:hypothetical protein
MDATLSECAWLVFHGVSASIAFGVSDQEFSDWMAASDARRKWLSIKFSEFNGNEFDIRTMSFKDQAS